ncbi:MAG: Hsp33 family molecular chaperone HslO [Deltaproteobacteria bacterium]|nr:Hsp33 family molecular chaperone HslO [Deltaproteobacteria bacterium]
MANENTESAVERYKRRRAERLAGPPQWLDPAPALGEDTMWRGLTRAGEVRILVARTRALLAESARRLGTSDDATRIVGELITACYLARSALNPAAQLQMLLRNPGSAGRLVADVWAGEEGARAAIASPGAVAAHDGSLLEHGLLEVTRVARDGATYRSALEYEAAGIEAAVTEYLVRSEQIVALVHLEVAVESGVVASSCGYLVQLTPEGTRAQLDQILARLERMPSLASGMTAQDPDGRAWATRLLDGFLWDQVARERPRFACRCSRGRLVAALSALPRADLQELVDAGEPTESICEYCNAVYTLSVPELQMLLAPRQ